MSQPELQKITDVQNPAKGIIALDEKGHERYFINGHWVRYYPEHARDDLETTLKLVHAFEKRFQKAVEAGLETIADDDRIEKQRDCYNEAKNKAAQIADFRSREYKEALADEQVFGGMLAVNLYHRMIKNISRHIDYRISEKKGDTSYLAKIECKIQQHLDQVYADKIPKNLSILDRLEEAIESDMAESFSLFNYVRRAGGQEDRDNVLNEMRGEAMNIFVGSLPRSSGNIIKLTYGNRYDKISKCWMNIDQATTAIKTLISTRPILRKSGLPELIDDFSESARSRCELMRSDPDFDIAAGYLRSNRNQIKEFTNDMVGLEDKDYAVMKLVQDYRKLVYDIAHVRTPRSISTNELDTNVKKSMIEARISRSP